MKKEKLTILAVSGSGAASTAIITKKIEKVLAPLVDNLDIVSLLPTSVEGFVARGGVDFVVTTTPIPGEVNVPVIEAIGMLTGFGEDMVMEEILATARYILSRD